jgi:hypothetical protein
MWIHQSCYQAKYNSAETAVEIAAKYKGTCQECRSSIKIGQRISLVSEDSVKHVEKPIVVKRGAIIFEAGSIRINVNNYHVGTGKQIYNSKNNTSSGSRSQGTNTRSVDTERVERHSYAREQGTNTSSTDIERLEKRSYGLHADKVSRNRKNCISNCLNNCDKVTGDQNSNLELAIQEEEDRRAYERRLPVVTLDNRSGCVSEKQEDKQDDQSVRGQIETEFYLLSPVSSIPYEQEVDSDWVREEPPSFTSWMYS